MKRKTTVTFFISRPLVLCALISFNWCDKIYSFSQIGFNVVSEYKLLNEMNLYLIPSSPLSSSSSSPLFLLKCFPGIEFFLGLNAPRLFTFLFNKYSGWSINARLTHIQLLAYQPTTSSLWNNLVDRMSNHQCLVIIFMKKSYFFPWILIRLTESWM